MTLPGSGLWQLSQRVVVKETYKSAAWDDPAFWHDVEARIPREPTILEALLGLQDHGSIVETRHCRRYMNRPMYRLYMEYCEYGDLGGLVYQHWKTRGRRNEFARQDKPRVESPKR